MANAQTIDVPGVGPVLFRRNRRAKRIIISVSPLRGVRATVPGNQSFKRAEMAVVAHREWITEKLDDARRENKQRQALQDKFDEIGMAAARRALIERLNELAGHYGFTCGKISIRNQKTRWGSCSPRNNISLNARLVCLPDELRDYVILHELVHTRVHNHSREFHLELDKHVGNARLLSRRLRKIGLQLL